MRYQDKVMRIYFRADAAFAMPGVYEYLEAGGAFGMGFTVRDGDYYRHGAGDAHRFAAELAAMIG